MIIDLPAVGRTCGQQWISFLTPMATAVVGLLVVYAKVMSDREAALRQKLRELIDTPAAPENSTPTSKEGTLTYKHPSTHLPETK